jgi:DNA polymerase-3 subunit epsilon
MVTLPHMTLEEMAAQLEASGDYRVLRKLMTRPPRTSDVSGRTRVGLFVDVETTGLDPTRDEIIELAMMPFVYDAEGQVLEVQEPFHSYRQPNVPIRPEITALTGITDAMVADAVIDTEAVAGFAAPAAVVIAHNAGFDRRFLERICATFTTKPWACSMTQVDWRGEGFEGTKLAYLASHAGFFYDRHRAVNDCLAAIELLARPLPVSGAPGLYQLLDRARRPTFRIWAENSPFDLKDILKARGYRWNGDGNAQPRAWYIDVNDDAREAEVTYLRREIYQGEIDPLVRRIDAHDRFSDRC